MNSIGHQGRIDFHRNAGRWVRTALALALSVSAAPLVVGCENDKPASEPGIRIDGKRYRVPLFDDDYALGGDAPLVTIVVFTDYGCPPCGRTWQVMDNLVEDYGQDVRVVFRSHTVPGYGRGEETAEAVFAAGAQGKFWEMHRRLFSHPGSFDRPSLRAHAEELGLDIERFFDEIETGVHSGRRIRHKRQATALGLPGLPSTFVNGLFLPGYADEAMWHGVIDEEIRRVKEMLRSGTRRPEVYTSLMSSAATGRVQMTDETKALRKSVEDSKPQAPAAAPQVAPDATKRYQIDDEGAPGLGPADADVVVVEFVDFACPYCRRAWTQELQTLIETYKDRVRFSVRHLPLPIHPTAKGVARASVAAQRQGKFWEFHELAIGHTGEFGRSVFVQWAKTLKLDVAKFEADLDDPEVGKQVEADMRLAHEVGISGTPAWFVNGRYARGFRPGVVPGLIAEELTAAEALKSEGVADGQRRAKLMLGAIPRKEFPNR